MKRRNKRKALITISLGYLIALPILFYLKSLTEPPNWWTQSAWHPLEVLIVLEATSFFSLWWNLKMSKGDKEIEDRRKQQ